MSSLSKGKPQLAPDNTIISNFLKGKAEGTKTGFGAGKLGSANKTNTPGFSAASNSISGTTTTAATTATKTVDNKNIKPFLYEPELQIGKEFIDPREKRKEFKNDFKLTGVDFALFEENKSK